MTIRSARMNARDNAARGDRRIPAVGGECRIPSAGGDVQVTSAHEHSPTNPVRSASLRGLTDTELLVRLLKIRGIERAAQVGVVQHLVEVDRRRLYLPRGYGSLFEFCTGYLKYSRSSAARRIGAARCIGRFPRVAELFERGELDLTVIALVAGVLTDENCGEVVSWLRGRFLREVEAFAARRQPGRAVRDQVRKIYIMSVKRDTKADGDTPSSNGSPAPAGAARNGIEPDTAVSPAGRSEMPAAAVNAGADEVATMHHCPVSTPSAGSKTAQSITDKSVKNRGVHSCSGDAARICAGAAPLERITVEPKYKLQFAVGPAFMEKLERVKSLLSTKHPWGMSFEMIFDTLMSEYLERHGLEERIRRRDARREHKKNKSNQLASKDNPCTSNKKSRRGADTPRTITQRIRRIPQAARDRSAAKQIRHILRAANSSRKGIHRSRHIPQAVRDEVFRRDGGRCSFVGDDGKRCESAWNLQIDHVIPYAKGGDSTPGNLRLLCAEHNRLEAERAFGTTHM